MITSGDENERKEQRHSVSLKIALIGDAQAGKTSFMVKYVNNSFDEGYKKTMGVNYMNKVNELDTTDISFSIWDLGGSKEFENMVQLATDDAIAVIFMFDLTKPQSLESIKSWYKLVRSVNRKAIPILVGTKYDLFFEMPKEYQKKITDRSLKFAKAMKSSIVFASSSDSINVQKVFKLLVSKAFDLNISIPQYKQIGEPILIYDCFT